MSATSEGLQLNKPAPAPRVDSPDEWVSAAENLYRMSARGVIGAYAEFKMLSPAQKMVFMQLVANLRSAIDINLLATMGVIVARQAPRE